MRLQIGAIAVLMLLSLTAQASIIEDHTTKVHPDLVYQNDGGVPGDAPDECVNVDERRQVAVDENADTDGMIVQVDDESDVYQSNTDDWSGERLFVQVNPAQTIADLGPVNIQELDFTVWTLDCEHNVLDEDDPLYDPIDPQPGTNEKVVYADLSKPCKNDKDYWKFHISGDTPDELFIEWTNGEYERRSFIDLNDGAGNYITTANTEYTIRTAEAIVPADWDGKFWLNQRPCDTVDGGAEPLERVIPKPDKDGLYAEYEAREEAYIIQIYLTEGASIEGISESMHVDCHEDYCLGSLRYAAKSGLASESR